MSTTSPRNEFPIPGFLRMDEARSSTGQQATADLLFGRVRIHGRTRTVPIAPII